MAYRHQSGSCSTASSVLLDNRKTKTLPSLFPFSSTQHSGPQMQEYLLQTLCCSSHFQLPKVLLEMLLPSVLLQDGCLHEMIRQSTRRLVRAEIKSDLSKQKNHLFFLFPLKYETSCCGQGRKRRNSPSSSPSRLLPFLFWLAGSDDQGSLLRFSDPGNDSHQDDMDQSTVFRNDW